MSSPKLLLNAEPFGFGPSAAIASVFPHLRDSFDTIGYVGKHHTLDLQTSLPYDQIHDVSDMGKGERADILNPIFAQYDVFFSAMDHKMIELAQNAGLPTIYYDALTWYWRDIPQSVQQSDLYIAQDFFGVETRLKEIFAQASATASTTKVSPIVSPPQSRRDEHYTLINLGGLQNPFWPVEDITIFAKHIIAGLKRAIPTDQNVIIACSAAVAERLNDPDVKTYPRSEMQDILAHTRTAFMTPGLGNIYDAAAYNIPTMWLPPANDSQGQQLRLLAQNNMLDASLDWHLFTNSDALDYKGEQVDVLQQISNLADDFTRNISARTSFEEAAKTAYQSLRDTSATCALIKRFGMGGEKQIANALITKTKDMFPKARMK